jgi:hypothetical protein
VRRPLLAGRGSWWPLRGSRDPGCRFRLALRMEKWYNELPLTKGGARMRRILPLILTLLVVSVLVATGCSGTAQPALCTLRVQSTSPYVWDTSG